MKMKKKNIFLFTIISFFLLFGCDKTNPNIPDDPIDPVTKDEISIDIVEYKVCDLEELSFPFVIAKVRIKALEEMISLKDFTTNEQISLVDVDTYLDELSKYNIYVGKQNVQFNWSIQNESEVISFFIPVQDKYQAKIDLVYKNKIYGSLDLENATLFTKDELGYQDETTVGDGKNYQVSVLKVLNITGEPLYQNNEIVGYPSTAELYAFRIEVLSMNGEEVSIQQAEYITEEKSDTFEALDSSFEKTEKRKNIIDVSVNEKQEGYLLFMTLNPEREVMSYKGILRLKVKDSWYNIPVDL